MIVKHEPVRDLKREKNKTDILDNLHTPRRKDRKKIFENANFSKRKVNYDTNRANRGFDHISIVS